MRNRLTVTATIALSGTDSGEVGVPANVRGLTIFGPAELTGAVTVTVAPATAGTFNTLAIAGTDVAVAAAKATMITGNPAPVLKLHSDGAEAAARTFTIVFWF